MKKQVIEHLKNEHALILKRLEGVESVLGIFPREGLKEFLDLVQMMENHFQDERDIVFPELDELPRKEPLKLANLEHDDWVRIHKAIETTIFPATKFGDKKSIVQGIRTARDTIDFIRKHFRLEEELVFPLINQISEEQVNEIVEKSLFRDG